MFAKGNKLYSVFRGVCPKCHNESMYVNKNPYFTTKLFLMHSRCSHCDTKYKIEPSFFFGAMYVSYGIGVAVGVACFVISYLFLNLSLLTSFFVITAVLILLFPIIARLGRNVWINLFMKYDAALDQKETHTKTTGVVE
ncbi:DUF983 domain-containing protein [Aquimarina algicola]|uniref:DUF983 domain-containing protein n=1 Tax=Aquimarina algicola TaxID=2589995 RepID=A0A504J3Y1_9FLAO|nr:DUF983 domain-containing protein [Aquimarina algicola]TPN81400.1 DUF983 domain-containing protein [Aquimarina algicola]